MKSKVQPKVSLESKKSPKKVGRNDLIEKKSEDLFEGQNIKPPKPQIKKKSSLRTSTYRNNLTSQKSVRIMDSQSIKEEEKSNLNIPLTVISHNTKIFTDLNSRISKNSFDNHSIYTKSKYDDLKSNISKTVVSKTAVSKTSLNKSINSLNTTFAGNLDFNSEVINEKRTKDALKRLLKKSNDLLNTQNGILAECDELAKNVNSNDIEIENLKLKQDNDNFPEVLDNYSKNLNGILGKLKKDSVELEEAKQLREENKSLKYKIQILSIDKSDDYLNIEAKLNSVKNIYSNEINSMINFFDEIGLKDYKTEKMNSGNFSEDKVISFFSLIKKYMKDMKNNIDSLKDQIKYLSQQNGKILQRMNTLEMSSEPFMKNNNINYNENMNDRQYIIESEDNLKNLKNNDIYNFEDIKINENKDKNNNTYKSNKINLKEKTNNLLSKNTELNINHSSNQYDDLSINSNHESLNKDQKQLIDNNDNNQNSQENNTHNQNCKNSYPNNELVKDLKYDFSPENLNLEHKYDDPNFLNSENKNQK